MKPSGIAEALRIMVRARQPVFVWSGPGTGKSSAVAQVTAGPPLAFQTSSRQPVCTQEAFLGFKYVNYPG